MDRHPLLRIDLAVDDRLQDLVTEGVVVALRLGTLSDSTSIARRITAWPRLLVASPDYLAKVGTPKTPADLSTHTVIARPGDAGPSWSFRKHGKVASVRVAGRLAVTLNEAAIAASVAGLGIVSTDLWACRKEITSGALVQVLPDWDIGQMELHALLAAGRAAKPSARVFTEFLVAEFRNRKSSRNAF